MAKKIEIPIVLDDEEQAIEDALEANLDSLQCLGGIERLVEMAKVQIQRNEARTSPKSPRPEKSGKKRKRV